MRPNAFSRRKPALLLASLVLTTGLVAALVFATMGAAKPAAPAAKKFTIGAIFVNSYSGSEYNKLHVQALKAAMKIVGKDKFVFKPVFNVPFTERATQTTLLLFNQGADLVIDTLVSGPLFFAACKQVPTKKCLGYVEYFDNGKKYAPNIRSANQDQALFYYPLGVAAGLLTKTGTIGMVGSFPAGFQIALTNAYALGCQSVRPDCKVRNVYINSFLDPPKAIEATNTLLDSGADVIAHFHDQNTPLVVTEQRGAWGIGHEIDDSKKYPKSWAVGDNYLPGLTSIYAQSLRALVNGTWKDGGQDWGTIAPPNVDFSSWGKNVPAKVRAKTVAVMKKLRSGWNPFVGPILDDKGKVRVPKGKTLPIRGVTVNHWTWSVKGVIGG